MSAYLAGVTQAPLTSAVISMGLTDNHDFVLPIMAACLLRRTFPTLACKTPVYRAFAQRLNQERDVRSTHNPTKLECAGIAMNRPCEG